MAASAAAIIQARIDGSLRVVYDIFSLKWIKFNLFSNPPQEHFFIAFNEESRCDKSYLNVSIRQLCGISLCLVQYTLYLEFT